MERDRASVEYKNIFHLALLFTFDVLQVAAWKGQVWSIEERARRPTRVDLALYTQANLRST